MPEQLVIVIMGVAGSGKTTVGSLLARELGWQFFDADDDHQPQHIEQLRRGQALTEVQREPWLAKLRRRIDGWIDAQTPAVLACSALTRRARSMLRCDDPRVRLVYLRGDRELIQPRMQREHFMPPSLLESQFTALEEPREAIVLDAADQPQALVAQIRRELAM